VNTTDTLTQELLAHLKGARDIAAAAEDAGRDFSEAERGELQQKLDAARDLRKQLDERKGDDQLRSAIADLGDGIELNGPRQKTAPSAINPITKASLGADFTTSAAYQALLDAAPGRQFGEKSRIQSQAVGYKSLVTGTADDSAGALIQNDWRGLQTGLELFQRPLTLREVVTAGTTSSDTVEYARVVSTTNAATPVPEATATAGTSGTKPESGFTTTRVTTPVRTLAHWMPITKRALSDAAQVRTLIDAFLMYGLEEELEDQMVAGDGTGENFTGLRNTSGIQIQAYDGTESDLNLLRTLRKARTLVRIIGRAVPTAYLLNPVDMERVDLTVDGTGRFYLGGPRAANQITPLWSLPVIESEAIPAGTGYVGDWSKAVLWDREQASLTVTDSHADFFIRNLVAILAEMRAAFGIIQPSAFVQIALEPAAP